MNNKLRLVFNKFFKRKEEPKEERNGKQKYMRSRHHSLLIEKALLTKKNNIINRHLIDNCNLLYEYDKEVEYNTTPIVLEKEYYCYGCNNPTNTFHGNYVYSCLTCGDKFENNRHVTRDLTGQIALIIGGRTKLGHQIVIKLLDANCKVILTTRKPSKALNLFKSYKKWDEWKNKIYVYPKSLDLNVKDISKSVNKLNKYIQNNFGVLDILINCAAQTIRVREKGRNKIDYLNRYNDAAYVDSKNINSWGMRIFDLKQKEMEEIFRINAIAPTLIIQSMYTLMKQSKVNPYIINVHAREGLMSVAKSPRHIHTNMGKAAIAMLTNCLNSEKLKTESNLKFRIHGCDPGWISVDEYYKNSKPFEYPPLDEVDGAARILYPLFKELKGTRCTRRHFDELKY